MPDAVDKVFAAKGRPSDNPLIVHCGDRSSILRVAECITSAAERLLDRFSPGPLTVVLPARSDVPRQVTAGLDTVAVRIPRHPLAQALCLATGTPLVGPSANRSGRPSPTTWMAVLEDLDGEIDGVLLGQATEVGLESTVVDCSGPTPKLLRSGAVTREQLLEVCPDLDASPLKPSDVHRSPGLKHRHYAPAAKVVLVDDVAAVEVSCDAAIAGLLVHPGAFGFGLARHYKSIEEYARDVYELFRESDRRGLRTVFCQRVDEDGLGQALMDRLRRAAQASNVDGHG